MEYFTTNRPFFLVPSNKCCEEFEKIDKFMVFLEKSGVWKILKNVKLTKTNNNRGRKGYDVYKLFAAIIYCFTKFNASLRDIEDKCIFDFRVLYIMGGEIPDHSVIGDFINDYIVPYQHEIFVTITRQIINDFNLVIESAYVDGSKFEANENKYKFVWKPTKFHQKLDNKIKALLNEIGYADKISNDLIKAKELYLIINDYANKNNINVNNIPKGKGIRVTKEIKNYKLALQYLLKLLEYEEKENTCGENRNSYYKTDKDATAMMLKEDYYSKLSNDFHAAYNIQVLVSNFLILMYGVYQNRTDYHTFIPLLDKYYKYYHSYPINAVGDSGYGIYTNYKYLREHNIGNYLKFQQWNGESSGKRPQLFYTFEDGIICLNANIGKPMPFKESTSHQRNKETKLYRFEGCNNCNYVYKCKKNLKNKDENFRLVEINSDYELLKNQARENLLSPKGIEIRINRSIQVEGTFGQIKNNMNYERIRRRGINKVSCEIMLMCLGVNLRKLFNSFEKSKFKNSYWEKPKNLKKETFPYPKQKKNC